MVKLRGEFLKAKDGRRWYIHPDTHRVIELPATVAPLKPLPPKR